MVFCLSPVNNINALIEISSGFGVSVSPAQKNTFSL